MENYIESLGFLQVGVMQVKHATAQNIRKSYRPAHFATPCPQRSNRSTQSIQETFRKDIQADRQLLHCQSQELAGL